MSDTRACFYCANTHNFTDEECKCACHKVAPIFDKLEAIEKDLGWTIPQLIAVKKLLELERVNSSGAVSPVKDGE